MKKPSLLKIIILCFLLLCGLMVLEYSFVHQTPVEITITLLVVIAFLVVLSIWFYVKRVEDFTSNYQKLFNGSPLAIYIMSLKDLKILATNDAMTELYGYTRKEFLNMTALDIRPKENHETYKDFVISGGLQKTNYLFKDGKHQNDTDIALHQKKNGEKFYIKYTYHEVPLVKKDALLVMITNIDKTLKDERRINELVYLYEVVNKAINDVIWDYNILEDKLSWMEGFEKTFGYKKSINPDAFSQMQNVFEEDRAGVKQFFKDIISNKQKDWTIEYRYLCADGSFKYVKDKGITLFNKAGKPIRLVGAVQDVDKQKRYEQQLINQNEQLKEIGWINSHEVRRPLSNIIGLVELIKDYPSPSEEMTTLINHLCNSSKELDEAVNLINKRACCEE